MAVSAKQELNYVASNLAPSAWHPLMAISELAMVLMGWLSVTVEVFVRRDFGERYFSWLRLLLGYLVMDLVTLVPRLVLDWVPFASGPAMPLIGLFTRSFVFLSLYHQWCIWRRNRQGVAWHSNSFGVSRLSFLPISDWVLYRFVEPGICLVAGLFVQSMDPITGIWIIVASLALFMKNQMVFNAQRGRFLDVIDARIESAAMQGALEGRPKRETAGFSVMAVPAANFLTDDAPNIAATVSATLSQPEEAVTPVAVLPAESPPAGTAGFVVSAAPPESPSA